MSGEGAGREEAYVLRFVDASLAARVRAILAEEPDADPADALMELDFDEKQLTPAGEARVGTFTIAGESYPVFLLDSPSIIEAYSTLDDANLVKTADVGQILLVARQGATAPPPGSVLTPAAAAALQRQMGPTNGAAPCAAEWESRDGLTPPMTDARSRHFARVPVAPRDAVAAAEAAILRIAAGSAPDGVTFEDVEEEYYAPNEHEPGGGAGVGGWKPVRRGHKAKPIAVAAAEIAKKKKEVKARARVAALMKGMTHTEARKAAVVAAAKAAAALQSNYAGVAAADDNDEDEEGDEGDGEEGRGRGAGGDSDEETEDVGGGGGGEGGGGGRGGGGGDGTSAGGGAGPSSGPREDF